MTTPPRKTKLYRKTRKWTRWAFVDPETGMAYVMDWWQSRKMTRQSAKNCEGQVIRVEVRELPKAAGRGKK